MKILHARCQSLKQTNTGVLCSFGANTSRSGVVALVWLLGADSKCCLAFTEEREGAQGEEGKSWCWQGGEQPCRKWRCQNRPGIPAACRAPGLILFPLGQGQALACGNNECCLRHLTHIGGVGKELKLSVCQGMLPHGSYCSSAKFTKQLLSCVLRCHRC